MKTVAEIATDSNSLAVLAASDDVIVEGMKSALSLMLGKDQPMLGVMAV